MKTRTLLTLSLSLLMLSFVTGCQPVVEAPVVDEAPAVEEAAPVEAAAPETNLTDGCVETYAEGIDYFPEKVTLEYAEDFTIEYFNNYKVITVTEPWPMAEEAISYVLVQCGTPAPEMEATLVIEVPSGTLISMSTSYIPSLEELGLVDNIVGMDSTAYAYNEAVRARVDAGEIAEIGYGSAVNIEAVLDLDPDLIFTYASGVADYDAHPALQAAGMPVVINAEQNELTPLGRAEWIKFIAAFYNLESTANAVFDGISSVYNDAVTMAASAEEKPTVFTNTPYDGTWFVPGGQSFSAQLIADAGGAYLWADDPTTGTLYLDFETVYEIANDADIWINPYAWDMAGLEQTDERFAQFTAFQTGQVYAYVARESALGGNDYFESGVLHPEWVLLDLIKIFHPDLLPEHELFYYIQLQ